MSVSEDSVQCNLRNAGHSAGARAFFATTAFRESTAVLCNRRPMYSQVTKIRESTCTLSPGLSLDRIKNAEIVRKSKWERCSGDLV